MKTILVSSFMAAVLFSPALLAQSAMAVSAPAIAQPLKAQYLSSNTVRAIFKGLRVLPQHSLQSLLNPAEGGLAGQQIAIFEVIEPLAFQAESSLLSNRMMAGDLFSVDMAGQRYGQSPEVTALTAQLQEGEEVVVKLDEYMTASEREGQQVISAASRMAQRNAAAEVQAVDTNPAAVQNINPAAFAPQGAAMPRVHHGASAATAARAAVTLNPSQLTRSNRMTRITNNNGNVQRVEIRQESIPGTTALRTRMFINGVEVDPDTKQPLPLDAQAKPADANNSNNAPIPTPAPAEPEGF